MSARGWRPSGFCHRRRSHEFQCPCSSRVGRPGNRGRDTRTSWQGNRRCHGCGRALFGPAAMIHASRNLSERYSAALAHYLADPDEGVLNQAYELGRKALGDGLGVLDIAMAHHGALQAAISDESRAEGMPASALAKAAEF